MSEEEQDKSHEPSEQKLKKARDKGDMPKTTDMTSALSMGGYWIFTMLFGGPFVILLGSKLRAFFQITDIERASGALVALQFSALVFVLPTLCVVGFLLWQKAIVFAPSKLAFKFDRLSPLSNAKQKFGISGWVEFFKSATKLTLYSIILVVFLTASLPEMVATAAYSSGQSSLAMMQMFIKLLGIVAITSIVIGGADYLWQMFDHKRKLKMSHKELRDEHKESEGDPHMKQSRRQKAMEIAMNQMLADVPRADVIIVNPTHFSVALAWSRDKGTAPECVAKGQDEIALKIREIAQERGIAIHSDPPTARAIYATVEVGQEVRPEHYQTVAAAIRFADRIRKKI